MPPKKKTIKEPEVTVPPGDPKIGKSIFEELCATCHGLEV
jgi:cytochrome c